MQKEKRLDPAFNIALMASAGTGKTYNLALRVVSVLLSGVKTVYYDSFGEESVGTQYTPGPQKILCLTFTRKATAEMQERILGYLNKIADRTFTVDDPQMKALLKATGYNVETLVKKACNVREFLNKDSKLLQVKTIDSFNAMILRLFPFETGIGNDFNIISGMKVDLLNKSAFQESFENLSYQNYYHFFIKYINWTGEKPYTFVNRLNENIVWVLNRAVSLQKELIKASELDINSLLSMLSEAGNNDNLLYESVAEFVNFVNSHIDSFNKKQSGILEKLNKIASREYPIENIFDPLNKLEYSKTFKKNSSACEDTYNRLKADIVNCVKTFVHYYAKIDISLLLHISAAIYERLNALKQQYSSLTYSDLNRIAHSILNGDDGNIKKDYFYFRLDGKLEHIFVDEFQDTSQVQWEILKPLVDEAMSGYSQNDRSGSFFCVGDPKQTIYRFRGSNPSFFQNVITSFGENIHKESLDVNHRSDGCIIDFINDLFKDANSFITAENSIKDPPIQQDEKSFFHESATSEKIEFDFILHEAKSQDKGYVDLRVICDENSRDRTLKKLMVLEEIVNDVKGAGWAYNDIAIIVSKKSDGFKAYESLKQLGIPVKLGFEELLTKRPAYIIIENLLKYMITGDSYYLTIFLLCEPSIIPPHRLSKKSCLSTYAEMLDKYIKESEGEAVYNRLFKLGAFFSLFKRLGGDKDFNLILSIIAEKLPTIKSPIDFAMRLEDICLSEDASIRAGDDNAINILTIHGSKGLQYPVVIAFDINDDFRLNRKTNYFISESHYTNKVYKAFGSLWINYTSSEYLRAYEKELMLDKFEKINKLYVALTRAENILYLLVESKKTISKNITDINTYILDKFPKDYKIGVFPQGRSVKDISTKYDKDPFKDICHSLFASNNYKTSDLDLTAVPLDFLIKFHDLSNKESKPADTEIAATEPLVNRMYGLFLHAAVAYLKGNSADDVLDAVEYGWKLYGGYLPVDLKDKGVVKINELLMLPLWSQIKHVKKYSEHSLFYRGRVITPDLYAVLEHKVILIDFKSSTLSEKWLSTYEKQLNEYKRALYRRYKLPVEAYILFMGGSQTIVYPVRDLS